MAFGMRHWIVLTLTGAALVALLLLPPGSSLMGILGWTERDTVDPAGELLAEQAGRVQVLAQMLTAHRRAEVIEERIAAYEGEEPVLFTYPEAIEEHGGTNARRSTLESARELAPPADLVVGVFYEPRRWLEPDLERNVRLYGGRHVGQLFYAGTVEGRPYCATVRSAYAYRSVFHHAREDQAHPLQLCRFWARYGPPGSEVDRWIRAGAAHFMTFERDRMPSYLEELLAREARRGLFGSLEMEERVQAPAPTEACLDGRFDVCGALLLDTLRWDRLAHRRAGHVGEWWTAFDSVRAVSSAFAATATSDGAEPFGLATPLLMHDLERAMGPERFRRFWTSELPVEQAFEEAFEERPGEWVHGWLTGYFGTHRAGPRLEASAVGFGLLLMVLAAGVAVGLARRREVG